MKTGDRYFIEDNEHEGQIVTLVSLVEREPTAEFWVVEDEWGVRFEWCFPVPTAGQNAA